MKVTKIETLACDAGWRNYHFVKLSTDEGIVGWSEFDEGFGSPGVGAVIERMTPRVLGQQVGEHERIYTDLYSATRPGSINLSTLNGASAPDSNTNSNTVTGSNGNIVFGPQSLTSILPDPASGTIPEGVATAADFTQNIQPQITINAYNNVDVQGGAFVKAPAAAMTVNANTVTIAADNGTHPIMSTPAGVLEVSHP